MRGSPPARETIRRVVLFGPTHRVPVRGLALPSARRLRDAARHGGDRSRGARRPALTLPQVRTSDAAHASSTRSRCSCRSCRRCSGVSRIVPFAVGDATPGEVAEVIELLWGGPETLFVVSSDLSHYHRYADARELDRATGEAILALVGHARSRAGLRRDADQRPARWRRARHGLRARAARPAQLRRHGGRQVPRGRLRVVRVHGDGGRVNRREFVTEPRHDRR